MGLNRTAVFPTSVWDGDSGNRAGSDDRQRAPDHRDWDRLVAEVAAAQTRLYNNERGTDDDTVDSVGTVATKTGLSVVEKGNGAIHKTILSLSAVALASTDGATAGTDGAWGTQNLYTFPQGHLFILGAHMVWELGGITATIGGGTGFSDTADIGVGVGTVAAANSTEWGLSTTEEDICAEQNGVDLVAATSDAIESSVNAAVLASDGSTAAVVARLNFRTLDDADHGVTADVLSFTGTVTILWTILGDD